MSENYIVINGKRAELTKEQMEQLGIEVEWNNRWRASNRGGYWFVNADNLADMAQEGYDIYDDFRYYSHNYFQTREEVETHARVLETEMLLKKYADEHNDEFKDFKCYLVWSSAANNYRIDKTCSTCKPRTIFFSSVKIVGDAIKEIGEERIIEYLTYEW